MLKHTLPAVLALSLFAGCGGNAPTVGPSGTKVGAQCTASRDCQQGSLCTTAGDFSNGVVGMCTVPCTSDANCPTGSACVTTSNQTFCAVSCSILADCAGFGRGWTCKTEGAPSGAVRDPLVCRLP